MHSIEQTKLMAIGDTKASRAKFVAAMIRDYRESARQFDYGMAIKSRNMMVRLNVRARLREDYGIIWRPR